MRAFRRDVGRHPGVHREPTGGIEGPVTPAVAASFLQEHPNAQIMLDEAAAAQLTRYRSPWLLGPVVWTDRLIRKAVIWLTT